MLGFGWCHLRTSREALRNATPEEVRELEAAIDKSDRDLFVAFRLWMSQQHDPFLVWSLLENHNNHHGLLTYSLSRNHRSSLVWEMLQWIVVNAPGSYGLFYCFDDEDTMDRNTYNRSPPMDYDNVFRVHRIKSGRLEELSDPFFGLVDGDIGPIHPYDRSTHRTTHCEGHPKSNGG